MQRDPRTVNAENTGAQNQIYTNPENEQKNVESQMKKWNTARRVESKLTYFKQKT